MKHIFLIKIINICICKNLSIEENSDNFSEDDDLKVQRESLNLFFEK